MSNSKSVPRIVPWLSAAEWRETRHLLYSNEVEDIRLGLLQAKIWMDRGKVPTAVESTVNFLETVLIDTEYLEDFLKRRSVELDCNDIEEDLKDEDTVLGKVSGASYASSDNDRVLRLAYNAATIRFVNELVDRAQKSLFATSITKLADQIGLPRFFVDIRHDGTHNKMNSLELLRWAAWEALKWLEDEYWSFEDDITPITISKDFNDNVHGLLDQYIEQLEKINEKQSALQLEKSTNVRIISQIDFLQTLPRIIKSFLTSLCDYKRKSCINNDNIFESIVRLLARNNWEIFCPVVIEILLERKETDSWIPWIIEELKKMPPNYGDEFVSELLVKFAGKSSNGLFKEKMANIWHLFGDFFEGKTKFNRIYSIFESVYVQGTVNQKKNLVGTSRNLLEKKRRYVEDENLDCWSIVNENWRPCPLGSIPK